MQTRSADCHGRCPKPSDTLKDAVNSYPEKFGGKLQPQLQSLCFRLSVHGASHQHPLKERANIISVIYLSNAKAVQDWARLMFGLLLEQYILLPAALLKSVMALLLEHSPNTFRSREKQSLKNMPP